MVTENVDIRFRETGARVIVRKIEEMGEAANRSTRGIFLLQRALFVLGGAQAIRALSTQADLLTNVENRLRLTTTSAENLEAVQTRLFEVAKNSRSSFESVAEIYSRTALSVKELGVSQDETARFTESLAKASILSGASTREASAALIQLSQGLASNRLSGDELRSVLEQLPFVADVIAKQMGITRGELRKFGADGKISAEIVLEAFRNAEDEINKLFADTSPTISQALTYANTSWLQFLDNLDDTYDISERVAKSIIFLADNIEGIVSIFVAAGAAVAASFGAKAVQTIVAFTSSLTAAGVSSARFLEVENLRAAANARRAQADLASNTALQAELTQRSALLALRKAELQQTVLDTQYTVVNGRARNIATGQFVSLTAAKANLSRVTQQLSIVEGVESATAARLATARAAQTGATNAASAANARLAAAQAASNSTTARLTQLFPTLAGGVGLVARGMSALAAVVAANPIGAAVVGAVAATTAFIRWGNEIKVTSDGVVGLKDAAIAAFQLILEGVAPIASAIKDGIGGAVTAAVQVFGFFADKALEGIQTIVTGVYNGFTLIPRVIVGVVNGIISAWGQLPQAAGYAIDQVVDFFVSGFENLANVGIQSVNKIIGALNGLAGTKVGEKLGFEGIAEIPQANLDNLRTNFGEGGADAAAAFQDGFSRGWESTSLENITSTVTGAVTTVLEPVGTAITDRARQNIANAAAEAQAELEAGKLSSGDPTGSGSGSGSGSSKQKKDFASILASMQKELSLLQLSTRERERAEEILRIEEELKRTLTSSERALADETLRSLQASRTQAEVLESIQGPRREAAEQMAALNALFQQGRIDINDYTTAVKEMQLATDEASGTLFGGFRASINAAILNAQGLGEALGSFVVDAAGSAADAIVEFAKTGELSIKEFFAELFANLLKLAAQQLTLQLIGAFTGVPLGGASTGTGILGFSSGGSIMPSGPGSTDTQLVAFAKRPDERVDILTPGQQSAQRNGKGESNTVVAPPANVNVAAVLSPSDIATAFDGAEGETVVLNILQRNQQTVKQLTR